MVGSRTIVFIEVSGIERRPSADNMVRGTYRRPVLICHLSESGRFAQIAGEGRPSQVQKDYSPTTIYDDYPISPTLFHWQSQSNTREDSPDRDPRQITQVHL